MMSPMYQSILWHAYKRSHCTICIGAQHAAAPTAPPAPKAENSFTLIWNRAFDRTGNFVKRSNFERKAKKNYTIS